MKIKLIAFARHDEPYITDGMNEYAKRIKHYVNMDIILLKPLSSGDEKLIKEHEVEQLFKTIGESDYLILLDKDGKQLTSENFASLLQKQMNSSVKTIAFVIGGAYGFSEKVYKRANYKLSLSLMTLPHQLCRLVFTEQLYRAFTIMKNEKYHH